MLAGIRDWEDKYVHAHVIIMVYMRCVHIIINVYCTIVYIPVQCVHVLVSIDYGEGKN